MHNSVDSGNVFRGASIHNFLIRKDFSMVPEYFFYNIDKMISYFLSVSEKVENEDLNGSDLIFLNDFVEAVSRELKLYTDNEEVPKWITEFIRVVSNKILIPG
ncbi:hypothetical protein KKD03_02065 [Patescibacteria group bacterium]|nr:hypothetical protein [Patescibacteria group bacterium]